MGCSPSKGQIFTGIYHHRDKALQFGSCQGNSDHFTAEMKIKSQTATEISSGGLRLLQEENPAVQLQGNKSTVCEIAKDVGIGQTNMHLTGKISSMENTEIKDESKTEPNECKRSRQKEQTLYMHLNSDPSQAILKAHEAANAYMTNNIPKFESLLKLLEKVEQTQLSLKPMVTLLSLQYTEINQTLDEIATEGEQMLAMHIIHRALPAEQDGVSQNPDIPEAKPEISPDMLQHILHQLIQEMRLVMESVTELGDTSLEETSAYFNSLSQLLAGNLEAKRTVELRLKQVLNCVDSYALRTLDSEDTALPSEDSGIGVENESHNGSMRYCTQQETPGLGVTPQLFYGCANANLSDQACVNVDENGDDSAKDIDGEDSNDDDKPNQKQERKCKLTDQKMSNRFRKELWRSPPRVNLQSKKQTKNIFEQRKQKDKSIRRAKSAENHSVSSVGKHLPFHLWAVRRSRSADCLGKITNDNMVQRTNRTNNQQKPEWITKRQNLSELNDLKDENNGPFKPGLIPSLMPAFVPVPPGKHAVRRLINTFSQRDIPNQRQYNEPTRFKKKKTRFLPLLTKCEAGVSSSGNNSNSYQLNQQFLVRPHNVDANSFPPPPPEILMDNSFKKKENPTGEENFSDTTNKNLFAPQSQKATMHAVLPHTQHSVNISETSRSGPYVMNDSHQKQDCEQSVRAKDKDEANGLYLDMLAQDDEGINTSFTKRRKETANVDSGEDEASTLCDNSCPSTIPPVSRARNSPSIYFTCHRVSGPTDLPPSPSYSVNVQEETSVTSQVQQRTRKDSIDKNGFETASGLKSFNNACSVFCQENQLTIQSVKHSCRSTLPRPWRKTKNSGEKLQAMSVPLQKTISNNILYGSSTDRQLLLSGVEETQ